jgi:hypothetical protein
MERHVRIEEPDGTVIPLELWSFQRAAVTALHEDRAVVVLKARRLGLSWVTLAYALWLAITLQGVRILILCKTEADASELLDRVRRMRDRIALNPASSHMLSRLEKPHKVRDAVTTLDVGASTLKALVGTPAAARSETAGLVILDEFAFQRGAGEIWRAVLPTVEGGGRLAVVSTGNGSATTGGLGAEFAAQWSRASSGQSGFTPLFFPWMERPGRDQAWKQRTLQQLGDPDRFRTEYPETPDDAFTQPDTVFVFDRAGVDAAEKLGAQLDREPPPPAGGSLGLGIDWGEHTHGLTIWPLEAGGVYIPAGEVAALSTEPGETTGLILAAALRHGHPVSEARYDAAGVQSMRTFAAQARLTLPDLRTVSVPFSKHKTEAVNYLRLLFRRAAEGKATRVIAISPRNVELLRQLRALQFDDDDTGKVTKGDDHGPDALIAGVAPIAHRHRNAT